MPDRDPPPGGEASEPTTPADGADSPPQGEASRSGRASSGGDPAGTMSGGPPHKEAGAKPRVGSEGVVDAFDRIDEVASVLLDRDVPGAELPAWAAGLDLDLDLVAAGTLDVRVEQHDEADQGTALVGADLDVDLDDLRRRVAAMADVRDLLLSAALPTAPAAPPGGADAAVAAALAAWDDVGAGDAAGPDTHPNEAAAAGTVLAGPGSRDAGDGAGARVVSLAGRSARGAARPRRAVALPAVAAAVLLVVAAASFVLRGPGPRDLDMAAAPTTTGVGGHVFSAGGSTTRHSAPTTFGETSGAAEGGAAPDDAYALVPSTVASPPETLTTGGDPGEVPAVPVDGAVPVVGTPASGGVVALGAFEDPGALAIAVGGVLRDGADDSVPAASPGAGPDPDSATSVVVTNPPTTLAEPAPLPGEPEPTPADDPAPAQDPGGAGLGARCSWPAPGPPGPPLLDGTALVDGPAVEVLAAAADDATALVIVLDADTCAERGRFTVAR